MSKPIPPIFAPWMQPNEEHMVMQSELWFPALKIHSRSGGKLLIIEAAPNSVIFGYPNGLRVLRMSKMPNKFTLSVYDAPDSMSMTNVGISEKPMYLINRLFREDSSPNGEYRRAIEKTDTYLNKMIYYFGYEMLNELKRTLKTDTNYKEMLSQEAVKSLVQLFNGQISVHDMGASERAACERAAKLINSSADNTAQISNALREAFDRDRWVVAYLHDHVNYNQNSGTQGRPGYYLVAAVNTSLSFKGWDAQLKTHGGLTIDKPNHSVISPLTCYRNFDDIPIEVRNELTTQLVMANLSIKGKNPTTEYVDPQRFIPSDDILDFDTNAYVNHMGGSYAMWMTVEKNDTRSEG